jgi:hypothetical protein
MTKKFDEFIAELNALCKKHNVVLSTYGYDSIQVWDTDDVYDSGQVVCCGIEDLTKKDSDL